MSANHKEMSFTTNLTFKEVFDELITAKDATIGTNEEVKQTDLKRANGPGGGQGGLLIVEILHPLILGRVVCRPCPSRFAFTFRFDLQGCWRLWPHGLRSRDVMILKMTMTMLNKHCL